MSATLQPVLACDKATASDITVFHSRSGETYEVYIAVALLERVGADPEVVQRKMLVGRLYNAGVALRELEEKFGHDGRTIKKWAAAMLTADIDEMARAFAGRGGAGKLSPDRAAVHRPNPAWSGQGGAVQDRLNAFRMANHELLPILIGGKYWCPQPARQDSPGRRRPGRASCLLPPAGCSCDTAPRWLYRRWANWRQ